MSSLSGVGLRGDLFDEAMTVGAAAVALPGSLDPDSPGSRGDVLIGQQGPWGEGGNAGVLSAVLAAVQVPGTCVDRFPNVGPRFWAFDASASAGWYSAVAGLIATACVVAIQIILSRAHREGERPVSVALLLLLVTFVTALFAAFMNAEIVGERECNSVAARVGISGGLLGLAGLLLLTALAWTLAENGVGWTALTVGFWLTVGTALGVLALLWISVLYLEDQVFGASVSPWATALVCVGPLLCFVASGAWRYARFRREEGEELKTVDQVVALYRGRAKIVGAVFFVAIVVLIGSFVLLTWHDVTVASIHQIAPGWVKYVMMWSTAAVTIVCITIYPPTLRMGGHPDVMVPGAGAPELEVGPEEGSPQAPASGGCDRRSSG